MTHDGLIPSSKCPKFTFTLVEYSGQIYAT